MSEGLAKAVSTLLKWGMTVAIGAGRIEAHFLRKELKKALAEHSRMRSEHAMMAAELDGLRRAALPCRLALQAIVAGSKAPVVDAMTALEQLAEIDAVRCVDVVMS